MISIVEGKKSAVFFRIKHMKNIPNAVMKKTFYDLGKEMVDHTRKLINTKPKHGELYRFRTGGGFRYHRASAPGEAPAVLSGDLRKSINFVVTGGTQMQFGVDSEIANVHYGKYLEYKSLTRLTGQGSHIKPRPYISGTYKVYKDKIRRKLADAINREFNR